MARSHYIYHLSWLESADPYVSHTACFTVKHEMERYCRTHGVRDKAFSLARYLDQGISNSLPQLPYRGRFTEDGSIEFPSVWEDEPAPPGRAATGVCYAIIGGSTGEVIGATCMPQDARDEDPGCRFIELTPEGYRAAVEVDEVLEGWHNPADIPPIFRANGLTLLA